MPTLHAEYITILKAFARLFSKRIWKQAKTLLLGAILSPAERTVTAALRVMGLPWCTIVGWGHPISRKKQGCRFSTVNLMETYYDSEAPALVPEFHGGEIKK